LGQTAGEDEPVVVIRYRTFRNSDPPYLADIWRSQPPGRALAQPMTTETFEQLVLAKPYFENAGLIIATDDDLPVGFAHAGFGPTDDQQGLSRMFGTTCLVMVRANYQRRGIGAELIARSEQYLQAQGAKVLYGGPIYPLNAFYLGVYGGSELPGVLDSARRAQERFAAQGYRPIDRVLVLQRDLAGFRPPVDRQLMQARRRAGIEAIDDPPARTWWEACTYGGFESTRFEMRNRADGQLIASTVAWNIQPLGASWGVHAAGLRDLEVAESHRRQGLGVCLLGEVFRHLQARGFTLVEAQTMEHNQAAQRLYAKLGFQLVDQGTVFRKDAPEPALACDNSAHDATTGGEAIFRRA
jgi:ribosomal protein S18 acetylase RimI-like enzyme